MNTSEQPNIENFRILFREDCDKGELSRVTSIAESLRGHIESEEISLRIASANLHGKPSHEIQACIIDHARTLGFHPEKKGLFSKYRTSNLRPDYYLQLAPGRGIILEVERGKTVANNMDLLDLWKCHICDSAQYLFLMVPLLRPDENGRMTKIFPKVIKRLEPFFRPENYVNVYAIAVFGY